MKNNNENDTPLDTITLIYDIDKKSNRIELFGDNFVRNNYNNCKISINNQIHDLTNIYYLQNKDLNLKEFI